MNAKDIKATDEVIDNQEYSWRFIIFNTIDDEFMAFKRDAVHNLVLYDSIDKWYHHGYADIENMDFFVDKASKELGCEIRNNDVNYLHLFLEPKLNSTEPNAFTIDILFRITHVQDILSSDNKRLKRIFIEDYRHFEMDNMLSTYNARGVYDRMTRDLTEGEKQASSKGEAYTGDILKDILSTFIGNASFSSKFDKGKYTISYTSPQNTPSDDLKYILKQHISSIGEAGPSILQVEREPNGKFSLIPLYEILKAYNQDTKETGVYHNERFLLASSTHSDEIYQEIDRADNYFSESTPPWHFPDLSVIQHYEFEEIQPKLIAKALKSTEVHGYEHGNKTFSVGNITTNDIKSKLTSISKGLVGANSSLIEYTRYHNMDVDRSIIYHGGVDADHAMDIAANDVFYENLILKGRKIMFNVPGNTLRRSGRVVSIENPIRSSDSAFDRKVVGQHLVTKVVHSIIGNKYINSLSVASINNIE